MRDRSISFPFALARWIFVPAAWENQSLGKKARPVHLRELSVSGFGESGDHFSRISTAIDVVVLYVPHSSGFARLVPPLAGEPFNVPSDGMTFYEVIIFDTRKKSEHCRGDLH